jgi:hypothetical protein
VAAEVTQEANDINHRHTMLERVQANLKALAHPQAVGTALADAGSCREANLLAAAPAGPALLMATNKDWTQRQALREQPPPRGRAPKGLTARDCMERTWLTTRGQTVEPVFGQIKSARGCDWFLRRGQVACVSEWEVRCATHNLLKLWRNGKAAWLGPRSHRVRRPFGRRNGKKTRG